MRDGTGSRCHGVFSPGATHPSIVRCCSFVEDFLGYSLDTSRGLTLNLTDLSNSIPKVSHQRLTRPVPALAA